MSDRLGDMMVIGQTHPPAKLIKAFAVVAAELGPAFARSSRFRHDAFHDSCVLNSLVVRDFLVEIGFHGAKVLPVATLIAAFEGEKILHSAGIGMPEDKRKVANLWNGHMVVRVAGWLIDTTLWRLVDRPAWRGNLLGMAAVEINPVRDDVLVQGLRPIISGMHQDGDYEFCITWLDNPGNVSWQRGPDACDPTRRRPLVATLVDRFGAWQS